MSAFSIGVLELCALLAISIFIFAWVRHMVIYAPVKFGVIRLAIAVATCVFIGFVQYTGHQAQLKKIANEAKPIGVSLPNLSATLSPSMKPSTVAATNQRYGREMFIEYGQIVNIADAQGVARPYQPTAADHAYRATRIVQLSGTQTVSEKQHIFAFIWGLAWLPIVILSYLLSIREQARLVTQHGFVDVSARATSPAGGLTFAEIEGFIDMLRSACDDADMYRTLERILTQTNMARKQMLHEVIADLRRKNAPRELIDAFVCLLDDAVAEKAYAVIYRCEERPSRLAMSKAA
jgi:hypothetical protein